MKRSASYLLIFTATALLAMPQGWCCLLEAKAISMRASPVALADCCCCPGGQPRQDRPAPADDFTPPRAPAVFCCCQPTPATVGKAELPDSADEGPAYPPQPALQAFGSHQAAGARAQHPPPPTRPLYLLRCVWLC